MLIDHIDVAVLDHVPSLQRGLSRGPLVYGSPGDMRGKPVLVRIRTVSGIAGTAQLRPLNPWQGETTESMVAAIRDYFAPVMLGRDLRERDLIYRDLEQVLPDNHCALCVVDCALHDLAGKVAGLPVASLLGGRTAATIPMEWSVGLAPVDVMVAEAARATEKYGVRVVCLKVGPSDQWRKDVDVVREVRSAVGPDVALGIDANAMYDETTTLRVTRAAEKFELSYLEQPLSRWDVEGHARLRRRMSIALLLDESVFTPQDALRVSNAGACDGIVLKLYKCGGITGAMRIAHVAEAAGVKVNIGGTAQGSQLEAAAAAQVYACLPNHIFAAEFIMGLGAVEPDPIVPEEILPLADGAVTLGTGSGLGADVDFERVEKASIRIYTVDD